MVLVVQGGVSGADKRDVKGEIIMRESFKPYFDDQFRLQPWGENDIVFSTEYVLLSDGTPDELSIMDKLRLFHSQLVEGEWRSRDPNEPYSHDNMSALYCLVKNMGMELTFQLGHWCRHPRDLIFYMYACNNKFLNLLGNLLFFIPFLCMVESCLNSHYKQIDGQPVLATDGKLLTWLRTNAFNLPLTKRICDYIIKKKYGSWSAIFDIYFKDPNHPNRVLAKERGI